MAILWELYGKGLGEAAGALEKTISTRRMATALGGVDLSTPDGALEASKALIRMGKTQEGMTLAQLAMQERNRREELGMRREDLGLRRQVEERQGSQFNQTFGLSQQQFRQQQTQQDRAFELQRSQAQEKPKIVWRKNEQTGQDEPYIETPQGEIRRAQVTGADGKPVPPSDPTNPFGGGKFNADQGKAAGFSDRMLQSESILSGVGGVGGVTDAPNGWQGFMDKSASSIPVLGNRMVSEKFQKYDQAKRDFINAQLRRESGAAISGSEFESAEKQYFPQPGDSPAVIQQKAANRRAAVEAMGREAGGSYRPRFVFDERGNVQLYRNAPPKGQQSESGGAPHPQAKAGTQGAAAPAPSRVLGPAPQGSIEGRTGTLTDGRKVVVRNGQLELAQ